MTKSCPTREILPLPVTLTDLARRVAYSRWLWFLKCLSIGLYGNLQSKSSALRPIYTSDFKLRCRTASRSWQDQSCPNRNAMRSYQIENFLLKSRRSAMCFNIIASCQGLGGLTLGNIVRFWNFKKLSSFKYCQEFESASMLSLRMLAVSKNYGEILADQFWELFPTYSNSLKSASASS